ncbi:MAG: 50S ribosomal protein L19 [Bacilli bacterium]|nr:50S ribosomal protein L19 [Bacilli bacterium]
MNVVDKITAKQIRTDLPEFRVGDQISVGLKIVEGNKERVQAFEGLVIAIKGSGISKTFTVRKVSGGVGVERIIPYNSPNIASITVVRKNVARRAKLGNWLRNSSKQPKLKERQ